jgi:hypothetical protein
MFGSRPAGINRMSVIASGISHLFTDLGSTVLPW